MILESWEYFVGDPEIEELLAEERFNPKACADDFLIRGTIKPGGSSGNSFGTSQKPRPTGRTQFSMKDKYARYAARNVLSGCCPHCGKPCAPYRECEARREYKRTHARRRNRMRNGWDVDHDGDLRKERGK